MFYKQVEQKSRVWLIADNQEIEFVKTIPSSMTFKEYYKAIFSRKKIVIVPSELETKDFKDNIGFINAEYEDIFSDMDMVDDCIDSYVESWNKGQMEPLISILKVYNAHPELHTYGNHEGKLDWSYYSVYHGRLCTETPMHKMAIIYAHYKTAAIPDKLHYEYYTEDLQYVTFHFSKVLFNKNEVQIRLPKYIKDISEAIPKCLEKLKEIEQKDKPYSITSIKPDALDQDVLNTINERGIDHE